MRHRSLIISFTRHHRHTIMPRIMRRHTIMRLITWHHHRLIIITTCTPCRRHRPRRVPLRNIKSRHRTVWFVRPAPLRTTRNNNNTRVRQVLLLLVVAQNKSWLSLTWTNWIGSCRLRFKWIFTRRLLRKYPRMNPLRPFLPMSKCSLACNCLRCTHIVCKPLCLIHGF